MPHAFGKRARTRDLFSKPFKHHGMPNLSTIMTTYHVGDYVDVIANGAIHKGMPHKFYHGKTGVVFDVTKTSLGVVINKKVRSRVIPKRIHIRIEHARKSQSREAFVARVQKNDALKREAKKKGEKVNTKRIPLQPREARVASGKEIDFMNPLKFLEIY